VGTLSGTLTPVRPAAKPHLDLALEHIAAFTERAVTLCLSMTWSAVPPSSSW